MSDDSKNSGGTKGSSGGTGGSKPTPRKPQVSKVVLRESDHTPPKRRDR